MERTYENIVTSFFYYMSWGWGTEEECHRVFGSRLGAHFWEKWCGIFQENKRGAAEIFYSGLSLDNRRKLVNRACEVYNGDRLN